MQTEGMHHDNMAGAIQSILTLILIWSRRTEQLMCSQISNLQISSRRMLSALPGHLLKAWSQQQATAPPEVIIIIAMVVLTCTAPWLPLGCMATRCPKKETKKI